MEKKKVIEIEVNKKSQHWICPFCTSEIGEKELYYNQETNQWFHRKCKDLGEIEFPNEKDKIILSKLSEKRIISEALLEIAKDRSETTFIDVANNQELIDAAKKLGIIIPSPDLSVMKTVYAEIDKVNLNGVTLPRKGVEEGLPTLVGKQCNWEHEGAGFVCGFTIAAKINGDKIETINVLFKSLFPEQVAELQEKMKTKEAAVSFEIWNSIDGKSVVKNLGNGIREINPILFHGTGVLLTHKPACPKAKIFKLQADKVIDEANKIVEKQFEENLVFAELAVETQACKKCGTCNCNKEDNKVDIPKEIEQKVAEEAKNKEETKIEEVIDNDYEGGEIDEAKKLTPEQRNALPDDDFALIQVKDGKKIRRFPINDEAHVRNALARLPQAKDITEEEKSECLKKILKKAKELHMDELVKKYESSTEELKPEGTSNEGKVENPEPAQVTEPASTAAPEQAQVTEQSAEPKKEEPKAEEQKENSQTEEPVSPEKKLVSIVTSETVTVIDTLDGKVERKGNRKIVRNYSDGTNEEFAEEYQVVQTYTQSQMDEALKKAKEELEILHKADLEAKTNEVKAELEKKITEKEAEIASLKEKVEKAEQAPTLEVGNVENQEKDEVQKQADNVNKIIAEKHKQNKK